MMQEWGFFPWPFFIPIVAIIGAFATAIVSTIMRSRVRELEIRERIAMIEKGLVPPPEVDPRGFERAMDRYDRRFDHRGLGMASARHRRAGITLIGVGVGLMVLIGFSGAPNEGIGVGGFLTVLGVAFLINGLFEVRSQPPAQSTTGPTMQPPGAGSNAADASMRE